ncbi:MAG: AraC family transcriptional regulator [Clostridiales bacterium]|nr:MAG: AraC family transcriptional regulator [Clostridiales bacterium]
MIYREIKADGFLENFIQCFWYYENDDGNVVHTIMPDGYFDLLIVFVEEKLESVKLTGIWTQPKHIEVLKNTKYFGIRFKLIAAEYIFKRELTTILNEMKELSHEFWSINTYKSVEFEKFYKNTTDSIRNSLKQLDKIDKKKLELFNLSYQNEVKSVSKISEEISWSSRQINRYFNSQYGFSLKEFLNIVRFESHYKSISNGEIQPDGDYFDQSHFIKEVKKYSGTTPKELYKNEDDRFLQLITVKK